MQVENNNAVTVSLPHVQVSDLNKSLCFNYCIENIDKRLVVTFFACNYLMQGSGTTHTIYKGNKRPCQKECILIVDHVTGEIVLEKLTSSIQLKKTR